MHLKRAKKLLRKCHRLTVRFAKENGLPENLCGCCAISSTALYLTLKMHGFEPKLRYGKTKDREQNSAHVWVVLEDKVFDPTYRQFSHQYDYFVGQPTVYHNLFSEVEDIDSLAYFNGWSEVQKPTSEKLEWFTEQLLSDMLEHQNN